jgi:uroporphyrinogen-III synthase
MIPVVLPCIAIEPASEDRLAQARHLATKADWIVITSPRTVRVLWPEGGMPPVAVAAVGEASAAVVASAGGHVELIGHAGGDELGQLLVAELARADPSQRKVLLARAARTSSDIRSALMAAGAEVAEAVVYQTTPIAPAQDPVEAVVFGSPSAVEGWRRSRTFLDLIVAVTGVTTADAVRAGGSSETVIAPEPGWEAALSALAAYTYPLSRRR